MTDIHHRIGVESPSTDDVYAALTTIDGLAGWWTTDTTGDPGLGGKIEFRFPPGGFDMEVIELDAGRARPLAGRRRPARVDRHHHRLAALPQRRVHDRAASPTRAGPSRSSSSSHCSTKWAVYLLSLKALVETGTGAPSPDDVPISDWH